MTAADILREHGITFKGGSRYYTTCPRCSHKRKHRRAKCLGVTVEHDHVKWGCNHCQWTGGGTMTSNASKTSKTSSLGEIVECYDYRDETGTMLFQVCRTADKQFPQRRPDGRGGWIWSVEGVRKVIYRLPEVIKAIASGRTILCVEGEKDVNNLWKIDIPATCNPGGAPKPTPEKPDPAPKWRMEYNEAVRGADFVICGDNDPPGRVHAEHIARMSYGIASRVRVLNLANHWIECPEKGDVSDWLAAGHTREELLSLIASAPDWTPPVDDAPKIIISSAEFVAGFTPPEYLIDRILQRRYIYSFTGKTGDGKTAVALSFAASIALGLRIGGHEVERNRVLYFAGENSTDVRQRWIAMAEQMKFNANTIDVHFVDGAFKLSKIADRVKQELEVLGEVALVIVDTAAAYFEGTEENDNVQMGNYARSLRSLIGLTGGPTVLVLCHPVKNATSDNLIPRGGGAFLAEMDGNLTCLKSDPLCTVHWQAKFRGCDFEPMTFRLQTTTATKLVDAKGRKVTTVVARPISEDEQKVAAASSRQDEDDVLIVMTENDGLSIAGIAKKLNWLSKNGEPQKSKVHRIVNRLREDELVREERGTAILTDKGEMAAETARSKRAAGRATTG